MLPALIFSIVQSRPLFLQFLPESLILQRRSSMLTQLRCDVVVIAVCRLCSISCSRLVFSVLSVERNFCYIVCCMSVRALMRVLMLAAIPERFVSLSLSRRSLSLRVWAAPLETTESVGPGFFSTSPSLYKSVDSKNTRQKAWQHERTRTVLTRMATLTCARRVRKLMKMGRKRPPIDLKLVRSVGMVVTLSLQNL